MPKPTILPDSQGTVGNNREACKKATVVEPLKAAGSIGGGAGGGAIGAVVTCSIVGAFFTGPTSPLWCSIVGGGAGGYLGGKFGSKFLGNQGEKIYETYVK